MTTNEKNIGDMFVTQPIEIPAKEKKTRSLPTGDPQKELVKILSGFSARHHHWQVFSDFCEIGALTFSNGVDHFHYAKREERYMQIIKGYNAEELEKFSQAFTILTLAHEGSFTDVLGRTYHDLELHNKWAGQYFSPDPICQLMSQFTLDDTPDLMERIEANGFVTAQEPACGSGAMVIALAEAMLKAGINYQKHLHVTAIDIDAKCVHMAYFQFSLLYIPATILHGNTLSLEIYDHWYTPAHILGGWNRKLRRRDGADKAKALMNAAQAVERAASLVDAVQAEADAEVKKEPKVELSKLTKGQLKLF